MPDDTKTETVDGQQQHNPAPQPEGHEPPHPQGKPPTESLEERIERMATALKKANSEAAKYRKQAEAFEQEKRSREEAELSELEKAKRKAEEAEAQLKAERLSRMQLEAATKIGLPSKLASRLHGETLEELEEDAKAILSELPAPAGEQKKTPPSTKVTNPGDRAALHETDAEKRKRIFGESTNIFDPEFVQAHGGGVRFVEKVEE